MQIRVSDIIYNICLNVIAGFVFWGCFNFVPDWLRRQKLRPKLELGMYQVSTNLFTVFDLLLGPPNGAHMRLQEKINAGTISLEDFELGLQDKCLRNQMPQPRTVDSPFAVGFQMLDYFGKIKVEIDRLFAFSTQLSTVEILCLERIRVKLETYDLEYLGTIEHLLVVPNISYMAENMMDLYELFRQLREIIFKNRFEDRNVLFTKVQAYYEQKRYGECIHAAHIDKVQKPDDKRWLEAYLFKALIKSGKRKESLVMLDKLLKPKPRLIYSRHYLADVLGDIDVQKIIEAYYDDSEIEELATLLAAEKVVHDGYLARALRLKQELAAKVAAQQPSVAP